MEALEHKRAPTSFLDLPQRLRLWIYMLATGPLGRPIVPIFINLGNLGAPEHNHHARLKFIDTYSLFLTSKKVYHEVSRLVYAFNQVFARPDERGSFFMLRRLRPHSIRSIQLLTIHVNVLSCGLADRCASTLYP